MIKFTAAVLGLALVVSACEPVPSAQAPVANPGSGPAATAQINQVFQTYTPLTFKAMRIGEMRQRLKAAGYTRVSSNRTSRGQTIERWNSVISRNGKPVSATRVRLTTCPNSTIVGHSRTTLDQMTASFAREVLGFIRARRNIVIVDKREKEGGKPLRFVLIGADGPQGRNRANVPRGQVVNTLGGLRIFDSGARRLGITIHTSCGK